MTLNISRQSQKKFLFCFFLITLYLLTYLGYDDVQIVDASPVKICNKVPSDISVFVSFKIPPLWEIEFLIGKDFVHAQPSVSFSTPLFEIGFEDEFPIEKTQSDFLYFIIVDTNQTADKQKKIYCFDLSGKSVEIVPSHQDYHPLRIIVSPKQMKVYQSDYELIQYETLQNRHILTVDISDDRIETLEIKPLDPLTTRLVKPKPLFRYCRETLRSHKASLVLVCPSDGLEFVLGFFPRLIGRFSPVLGWVTLLVVEGGLVIFLMIKAFEQKNFIKSALLVLFVAWLLLVASNIWPYALLYP